MKNIIIITVVAAVFMGAMGGGFYMLWSKISAMEGRMQAETQTEEEGEEAVDEAPKPIYKMTTMIANLADAGGEAVSEGHHGSGDEQAGRGAESAGPDRSD